MPSIEDLDQARDLYLDREPRDLFYRLARDLVERARAGNSDFTLTEAVAVVLQTWNRRFYIRSDTPYFDAQHVTDIESLIERHRDALDGFHARAIESLDDADEAHVEAIFDDFERLLGPVGAAKAMHVLAPRFFALWDRSIAEGASIYLDKRGTNSGRYWRWMRVVRTEAEKIGGEYAIGPDLLKRLDEFNYCRYTLKAI